MSEQILAAPRADSFCLLMQELAHEDVMPAARILFYALCIFFGHWRLSLSPLAASDTAAIVSKLRCDCYAANANKQQIDCLGYHFGHCGYILCTIVPRDCDEICSPFGRTNFDELYHRQAVADIYKYYMAAMRQESECIWVSNVHRFSSLCILAGPVHRYEWASLISFLLQVGVVTLLL